MMICISLLVTMEMDLIMTVPVSFTTQGPHYNLA